MKDVEIIRLGAFDSVLNRRDFDAVSYEHCYWRGVLTYEVWSPTDTRITVYSNRADMHGDDVGTRPGLLEEVTDDKLAITAISKAILTCFDHTTTVEAISDGNGGWIPLETDT